LHHRSIVASLAIGAVDFLEAPLSVCLVGLGGGCLAMFLRKHFPNANITVLELDPEVVKAAKDWFEFKPDDKLTCLIKDGVEFFHETSNLQDELSFGKFDVVILDVAGSESFEGGLSCPPPMFLEEECLKNIKKLLKPRGALALNLVVRCEKKSHDLKQRIRDLFETVMSHPISDDTVNELLICLPYTVGDVSQLNTTIQERLTQMHEYLAKIFQTPAQQNGEKLKRRKKKNKKNSEIDKLADKIANL